MTAWHGGKGSRRRESSVEETVLEDNWNRIFGDKRNASAKESEDKHPKDEKDSPISENI